MKTYEGIIWDTYTALKHTGIATFKLLYTILTLVLAITIPRKVHTMLVLWALNQNFAFNSRFSNSFEDLFSRKSAITFGLVDVVVHSEVVGDHFNGRNENHCAIWFQALLQIW